MAKGKLAEKTHAGKPEQGGGSKQETYKNQRIVTDVLVSVQQQC